MNLNQDPEPGNVVVHQFMILNSNPNAPLPPYIFARIFVFSGRKVTIAGSPEPVKSGSHRSGKFTSNKKKQASVRVDEAGNKTKIKVRTCISLEYKYIFQIFNTK